MEWKFYALGAGAIGVTLVALAVLVWSVMAEHQRSTNFESLRSDLARQESR